MMGVKPTLACGLQKSLGDLWKGNDFSDFTVVVENTSFQCHRFILSACSGFFQGLFRSQMKECHENCVKLGEMTRGTFDTILKSLYMGIDGLTTENVLDVWSATEQLQIRYLTEECENFAIENVSVDNSFDILRHAHMYLAENVVVSSLDFISRNFEQFRNSENLLQFSYNDFYRIIESDYLTENSEDVVLDTVIKWVEYKENATQCLQRDTNDTDSNIRKKKGKIDDTNKNNMDIEGTNCKNVDIEGTNGKNVDIEGTNGKNVDIEGTNCKNVDIESTRNKNMDIDVSLTFSQDNGMSDRLEEVQSEKGDRKQHMFKLISACRLFVISTGYLESLLNNNKLILSCSKTHKQICDALMYTVCVERRHDTWPEAAVHRVPNVMKHVMVFISDNNFMAYNLNSGSVHQFAKCPDDYVDHSTISVFDNEIYLYYSNRLNKKKVCVFLKNESWGSVTFTSDEKFMNILASVTHGCNIYCLNILDYIARCYPNSGNDKSWLGCCKIASRGDCLVRFQQYILVFYLQNDMVTAHCYNTETKRSHISESSMEGISKDMVSFYHRGDVFILQMNGSLWKIFSSDTDPVDFELVSKLWDSGEHISRGCIFYKKQLLVFCHEDQNMKPETCLSSLPGVFESIKLVNVKCESLCLPMVLSEKCLTRST